MNFYQRNKYTIIHKNKKIIHNNKNKYTIIKN